MAIPSRQIGWSTRDNLLWQISKQLERLTYVRASRNNNITTTTTTTSAIPNVVIGTQRWSTINLDVTTYRDGTPIPQVTDPTEWQNLTTGAWCYLNNDPANGAIYGKLYNWYAVNNTVNGGLAPVGQHIPTDTEFTTLTTFLGGEFVAGGKMKEIGTSHWFSPNSDATNSSGFTGLPGSYRDDNGTFLNSGFFGVWWSLTEFDITLAFYRLLTYYDGNFLRSPNNKEYGFSVRCIID
jgi:uncharacterized protein (TIGR02145 family)